MLMRKKILVSLLVIVIISSFIFWNKYKTDVYLFYNQLQFKDGFSVDTMVLSKASEFIPRISFYYNNNDSIESLDNYFDKKCKIVLNNTDYIYSKHIKEIIKNNNNSSNNKIILSDNITAEIITHKQNKFNILVSGKMSLSSNNTIFEDTLSNQDEIYYEYIVTFEKKLFFIWKATYFETKNKLIIALMSENNKRMLK
jgi:hypothetical protein